MAATNTSKTPGRRRTLSLALGGVAGALLGLGGFTFVYGQGLSYLSPDPRACANCHVMQDYFDSWQHGSHHAVAGCADCHLPRDPWAKALAKADNGLFHSLVFTLGTPDVIRIKPRNLRITEEACVACHRELVDELLRVDALEGGAGAGCVRCHGDVGHGPGKLRGTAE